VFGRNREIRRRRKTKERRRKKERGKRKRKIRNQVCMRFERRKVFPQSNPQPHTWLRIRPSFGLFNSRLYPF
jgi:hypothetical protein